MFSNLIDKADLFIFDFDGVIVRLNVDWPAALSELKTHFKIESQSILRLVENLNKPDKAIAVEILQRYELVNIDKCQVNPEIVKFLNSIQGPAKTAIFSMNTKQAILAALNNTEINKKFDYTISLEDVTKLKPNPEGLELIIKAAQVPRNRVIFFGDRPIDIQAGESAGIITYKVVIDQLSSF